MRYSLWIILLSTIASIHTKESTSDIPPQPIPPCTEDLIGLQLQCIGKQYSQDLITDQQLKRDLFTIIKRLPTDDAYYSLGLEFSKSTSLVVAKQTHYEFDWAKKVATDPRDIYYDHYFLTPARPLSKSLLVFLTKPLPVKLPVVGKSAPWTATATRGFRKEAFQSHPTIHALTPTMTPDCDKFQAWTDKLALADSSHIAIIADSSLWCPTQNGVLFDVVVGSYTLEDDTLTAITEVTRNYKTREAPRFTANHAEKLSDSLRLGGWLDGLDYYTADWLLSSNFLNLISQTILQYNLAPWAPAILITLYMTGLLLVAYILSLILYPSPFVFYVALYYLSVPYNMGTYAGYMALLWTLNAMRRVAKRLERKPDQSVSSIADMNRLSRIYAGAPTAAERARDRIFGLKTGVLACALAVIGVACAPSHLQTPLSPIIPLVWVLVSADAFPGVGGNSNNVWSILMMALSMLFGILMAPGFFGLAVDTITKTFTPADFTTPHINVIAEAQTFFSWNWGVSVLTIDLTSKLSMFFGFLGYFCLVWVVIDDFFGPTSFLNGIMILKSKKELTIPAIFAGIFTSPAPFSLLAELIGCLMGGFYIRLLLLLLAILTICPLWYFLGTRLWAARGAAADTINTRSDVACHFGEGPRGFRILLFRVACFFSLLNHLTALIGQAALIVTTVAFVFIMKTEVLTSGVLGLCTLNWSLVVLSITQAFPITESITMSGAPAVTLSGSNSRSPLRWDNNTDRIPPPPPPPSPSSEPFPPLNPDPP